MRYLTALFTALAFVATAHAAPLPKKQPAKQTAPKPVSKFEGKKLFLNAKVKPTPTAKPKKK